jgi:hypothetical protein
MDWPGPSVLLGLSCLLTFALVLVAGAWRQEQREAKAAEKAQDEERQHFLDMLARYAAHLAECPLAEHGGRVGCTCGLITNLESVGLVPETGEASAARPAGLHRR